MYNAGTSNIDITLSDTYGIHGEERWKIQEDLANRNWKKYKEKFKDLILWLAWGDEVAKRVSNRTDIKITHYIPAHEDESFFYTIFDSKGISKEKKLEEIKKYIDAVAMAHHMLEDSKAWKGSKQEHSGNVKRRGYS